MHEEALIALLREVVYGVVYILRIGRGYLRAIPIVSFTSWLCAELEDDE